MSEKANNVPEPSSGYKVFSLIKKLFIYLLAIGIIIAAIMFAADHSPNKSFFGYRYYTVLTPSMSPTYKTGDMVFVKLQNASDIRVGDVITFNPSSSSDAYLTHRVTQKLENYEGTGVTCFRTKGDANDTEDAMLIDQSRVIGSVKFSIPKLGYIVRFVQLRWYFVAALIILLWIFFRLLNMYLAPKSAEKDITPQETGSADKTE
ncbi:signal peptidase I [Ruminococcus sp.]|uniref:signal peptidase I n=1 Tax=Ruminococcus sp. TaxID=41978 RepID=UPI002CBC69E3|nr:signal peptidase I [Ruminococcus sp.]HNZ99175.1 signal peptidase I [Ruminococcus sp.]HOH88423.1 signal peptidase I [Ruminococcus sp.]